MDHIAHPQSRVKLMAESQTLIQTVSPLLASVIGGGLVFLAQSIQRFWDRNVKSDEVKRAILENKKEALFDLIGEIYRCELLSLSLTSHFFSVDRIEEMLETGLDPNRKPVSSDDAKLDKALLVSTTRQIVQSLDESVVKCKIFSEKSRVSGLPEDIALWGKDICDSPYNRSDPQSGKTAHLLKPKNQEMVLRCRTAITEIEAQQRQLLARRRRFRT